MFTFNFKLDEDLVVTLIRNRENSVLPKRIKVWYLSDIKIQSRLTKSFQYWTNYGMPKKYQNYSIPVNQVLISFPLVYQVESEKDKPYFIFCPNFSLFLDNEQKIMKKFGKGAFSNFVKTRNPAKFLTSSDLTLRTLAASVISKQPNFSQKFSTNYFRTSYELKNYFEKIQGFKTKRLPDQTTKIYNDTYAVILDTTRSIRTKNEIIEEFEYYKQFMTKKYKFSKDLRIQIYSHYFPRNKKNKEIFFGITSILSEGKKFKKAIKINLGNYYYKQTIEDVHERAFQFIKYYETIYNKITRLAGFLFSDNVELSLNFVNGKNGKDNLEIERIWVNVPLTKKYRSHWKLDWDRRRSVPINAISSLTQLESFLNESFKLYKTYPGKIDFHQLIPKLSIKSFFQRIFRKN